MRFSSLLTLLFPTRCIGCQRYGTAFCDTCVRSIALADEIDTHIYAVYNYSNQLVQRAVRELKYHRKSEAFSILVEKSTPYISEFIANSLNTPLEQEIILVPIPGVESRTNHRGFNQSALVANLLSRYTPQSRISNLLIKTRTTLPQARIKQKSGREKNVQNSMSAAGETRKDILYIVVDDVTTTGATFREAMRALRSSGACKILCIALAHGYRNRSRLE